MPGSNDGGRVHRPPGLLRSTSPRPSWEVIGMVPRPGTRVVALAAYRERRARVAPVCTGICRCWGGVPLGGQP